MPFLLSASARRIKSKLKKLSPCGTVGPVVECTAQPSRAAGGLRREHVAPAAGGNNRVRRRRRCILARAKSTQTTWLDDDLSFYG